MSMPIYEYKCEKCDCDFEMLLFRSDDSGVACPKCGSHEVKKLLSSACIGKSGSSGCSPGGSAKFS
jgi:putative FmdB family regulatory protein